MLLRIFYLIFFALTLGLPSTSETYEHILRFRSPDDFHVHFRQDDMLYNIAPQTASIFKRAMIMPNTVPPIKNGEDVIKYRQEILSAINSKYPDFQPLMTFKITPETTIDDIQSVAGLVVAGKLYPDGVTTNSQGGVTDFKILYPVFEAMQQAGIILSLHGEKPGEFCLDREEKFLSILEEIVQNFPDLKIVLEHVTTKASIDLVKALPENVAATITLHHMELSLDDVIGSNLHPHFFCKPIPKREEDQKAILQVAFSGNPKFFFGSDSAPHLKNRKECSEGCAGVFTAPVALSSLVAIFEKHNQLDRLEDFISRFGAQFYGLNLNEGMIEMLQKEWTVPAEYNKVVPYKAGDTLSWKVK